MHFGLGFSKIITKTILKNNQIKKIIPLKLTKIFIILIFKVLNKNKPLKLTKILIILIF